MLFFWLTICNKKGTVRDLCTIPLSSIIYYTIMKKISTTTYFHPILWHRIRCTSHHRHSPYMPPDLPHIPALLLHHGVWFRPVLEYLYTQHYHTHLHDLIKSNHLFPNPYHMFYKHYDIHTLAHHMPLLQPSFHNGPLPCAELYWPHTLPMYGYELPAYSLCLLSLSLIHI